MQAEPLILTDARSRHSAALAALASAQAHYSDISRRGDFWATMRAQAALDAAGRAYTAADVWLVTVLLGLVG